MKENEDTQTKKYNSYNHNIRVALKNKYQHNISGLFEKLFSQW